MLRLLVFFSFKRRPTSYDSLKLSKQKIFSSKRNIVFVLLVWDDNFLNLMHAFVEHYPVHSQKLALKMNLIDLSQSLDLSGKIQCSLEQTLEQTDLISSVESNLWQNLKNKIKIWKFTFFAGPLLPPL